MKYKYDRHSHGDFKMHFDIELKRNYWVLGYFGGGSINISEAFELAKDFSQEHNVPLETVHIDEILCSRRYKHFKILFSSDYNEDGKDEVAHKDAYQMEKVYTMLTD